MLEHATAENFQGYRTTECVRVTSACGLKTVHLMQAMCLCGPRSDESSSQHGDNDESIDVHECMVARNRGRWVNSVQDALLENGK